MNRVLICLAASKNWYGRLIRKLTGSKYNHAYIIYTSYLFGGWWGVEIAEDGVVKLPLEKIKAKYYLNDCFEYEYNLDLGLQRTRQMVGKKYDWLGVLGFGLKILIKRLFRRKVDNTLQAGGRLFCSEYVASVLKLAGAFGFEKVVPEEMSPGDIAKILLKNSAYRKVETP
jgi:hypothetical protein